MPVDFNAGNTPEMQTSLGDNPMENDVAVKTTNPIQNNVGIQMMDAVGSMTDLNILPAEKPSLQAPDLTVTDLMEETITLTPAMRAGLGIASETVSLGTFMKTCLEKLAGVKDSEKDLANLEFNVDKMSGEELELMCLLVCQKSKSQLVDVLKNILNAKTRERQVLNDKHMELQNKMAAEQAKVAAEAAKAKKQAIVKAVFGAVFAVVAAVVAVVATVATAGAGAFLFGFAIASAVCACAGAALSVTSSGLTIAALDTESQDAAEKLNEANKIVNWVNMGVSFVGVVCSIPNMIAGLPKLVSKLPGICQKVLTTAKDASKMGSIAETAGSIAQAASGAVSGGFNIAEGAAMERQAELEKEMKNIEIRMAENEQEVEILTQFIEHIDDYIQMFIKSILESEQMAGAEINRMTDNLLSLANQVPSHA